MKTEVLRTFSDNSILTNASTDSFQQHPGSISRESTIEEEEKESNVQADTPEEFNTTITTIARSESLEERSERRKEHYRKVFRKRKLKKCLPILTWAPEYTTRKLISDIIAGTTVGLTILPQGLAYATIANLPPNFGLYSGFIGPFVYILFGGTTAISIGPNAIQCILLEKFTHGKPPAYAVFLCFTSGVISLLMALLKLGFITNFISYPVISAYTSAVAITIVATQCRSLLGIDFEFDREGFLPTLQGLVKNVSKIQKWDSILSLDSPNLEKFLWLIATSRNAIVITGCTILVALLTPKPEPPIFSLVGELVPGLPKFEPPPFSIYNNKTNTTSAFLQLVQEEASAIFILPLLGLMGHIAIAKAFAGSARVDATQEVLSLGISNLISSFFSSMPIAGSFSRTTVNAFSGAATPLGGLITGLMVMFALEFLTPYFYYIPKSSLASVVVVSVIYMVDFTILRPLWRSKKADLLPWTLTFFVTLLAGVDWGILTGLAISAIFLLYHAARPRITVLKGTTTLGSEFILVDLDRSVTYPSVDYVTDCVMKSVKRWGNTWIPVVLDCHHIQFMDFTAAKALCDMDRSLNKSNYKTIFWKVKPSVLRVMQEIVENTSHRPSLIHCRAEYEMESLVDSFKLAGTAV